MSYGQGHGSNSGTKVDGSTARYLPFGDYRVEPGHDLTDRGFTGQKHNYDLGLVYMNARFYVGSIGRFASADPIVPDPMNPQQFNRYTYTLNNPLRFTDPTGHFSQDEIMASLTDQYGYSEAIRVWNLWMNDPAWMWALYHAQDGWSIWASEKGHGTFEVHGVRITIRWNPGSGYQNSELYKFQGQGGYLLQGLGGERPVGGPCHYHVCWQPVFNYDDTGRIIGNQPVASRMMHWEYNMFGLPQPFTYWMPYDIKGAPWVPNRGCQENFICKAIDEWGLGAVAPTLGFLNDVSSWTYETFYGLMVTWTWSSTPNVTNLHQPPASFQAYSTPSYHYR